MISLGLKHFGKIGYFISAQLKQTQNIARNFFGTGNRTFPPNIASLPESYFKVHLVLRHLKENVKVK